MGPGRPAVSPAIGERVRCQISRQRAKPPGLGRRERVEAGREGNPVPAPPASDTKHHRVLSATGDRSLRKETFPGHFCHSSNRVNCAFPLLSSPSVQKLQPGSQTAGFGLKK